MPALETLAVIAYKQPATVPEINEIRGVHVGGVIKTLLEKRLITTAGRKEVIGRPILYRTSKQFMIRFGLSDLDELPSLKEFEQLAQAALGSDSGIASDATEESAPASHESAEAAQIRASGETDDLAELGEDPGGAMNDAPEESRESPGQTRKAVAGSTENS
jgi:segregation and condensation protein B